MKLNKITLLTSGAIISSLAIKLLYNKYKSQNILCIELGGQSIRFCIKKLSYKNKIISTFKENKIKNTSPIQFINFLTKNYKNNEFDCIGVASFGPIILEGKRKGFISASPSESKRSWRINLLKMIQNCYQNKEIRIDTDVNCAALGEYIEGGYNVNSSIAYITVGTGVGVGLIINDKVVHGYQHPEGGHSLCLSDNLLDLELLSKSSCKYHSNCIEGFCASTYIAQEIGCEMQNIDKYQDDKVWLQVGKSLAQLCYNLFVLTSVEKIVIGGGISNHGKVVQWVQVYFDMLMKGYVQVEGRQLIVNSKLKEKNALIGCCYLFNN